MNPLCLLPGDSPLHIAIEQKHAGEISLLLRSGADPTMRNSKGRSPLDNLGMYALSWLACNRMLVQFN
eukprot:COSAG01_NODE_200_length_22187_cov_59.140529_17_plen_68_part_00